MQESLCSRLLFQLFLPYEKNSASGKTGLLAIGWADCAPSDAMRTSRGTAARCTLAVEWPLKQAWRPLTGLIAQKRAAAIATALNDSLSVLDLDNLSLVVGSASLADTMRQCKCSTFAAFYQIRNRHFPVCSSLISMGLG